MKLFLIIALCLNCLSTYAKQMATPNLSNLIAQCNIYNGNGERLRRYPGLICVFEEDGYLLISSIRGNELSFLDPNMRVLWKIPMHTHHQINKTIDGNFLVLSSETKNYLNKKTRFDRLVKINRKGEIVASFSFYDHKDELLININKDKFEIFPFDYDKENQDLGVIEISHANSFYEIPPNLKSKLYPELHTGNIIVNANSYGRVMILDAGMTHILKSFKQPSNTIHDVQITSEGNFLLYNNTVKNVNPSYSEVQIYSYPGQLLLWNYHRGQKEFSYPYLGGVQLLGNDEMLFSDIREGSTKAVLLNMKTKKELKIIIPEGFEKKRAQQVKMMDLSSFLKINKG